MFESIDLVATGNCRFINRTSLGHHGGMSDVPSHHRERPPSTRPQLTPTIVGGRRTLLNELHVRALGASWSRVLGLLGGAYLGFNLLFAAAYLGAGDAITGARPGSFVDAFNFSVQTFSTIGYGHMTPRGIGNVIVAIESVFGALTVALSTGLMFAKFAKPTAGVDFSKTMVIRRHHGVPTLMFRLANARANQVIEASVRCVALKDSVSPEGERMRSLDDLRLIRNHSPLFAMSWLVMHPIDAESPLFGLDDEARRSGDVRVAVSFTGLDSTLSQHIHSHHLYLAEDILEGRRFVDVLERHGSETRILLDRLHDTEPEERATTAPARAD